MEEVLCTRYPVLNFRFFPALPAPLPSIHRFRFCLPLPPPFRFPPFPLFAPVQYLLLPLLFPRRASARADFEDAQHVAGGNEYAAIVFHRDQELLGRNLLISPARP